jgi:integrase
MYGSFSYTKETHEAKIGPIELSVKDKQTVIGTTKLGMLNERRSGLLGFKRSYAFERHGLQRAGIADFRWHDLRHTFATWHRQAGTPTHELQRLGGWKTGGMVERYAHVAPEALQSAANRLDALGGYVLATLKQKGSARES